MTTQAQWHTLTFGQSSSYVRTIKDLSFDGGLETEKTDDSEGKEPEAAVRESLHTLSVSYTVAFGAGINPYEEISLIESLSGSGYYAPFYLNGRALGGCDFLLTKYSIDSSYIDAEGRFRVGDISLEFEEYAEEGGKRTDKGKATSYTPGVKSYSGGNSVLTALRMGSR